MLFTLASISSIVSAGQIKFQGLLGTWSKQYTASKGYWLCGAQMQYEDKKVGDSTATNGFRFIFCKFSDWASQEKLQFKGIWGDWKQQVMCPKGSFASGFTVRFEPNQGIRDDTAMNGLKLICKDLGQKEKSVTIYQGEQGDWGVDTKIMELDSYINGFKVRSEKKQNQRDDTAVNGLQFIYQEYKPVQIDFDYRVPDNFQLVPQEIGSKTITNRINVPVRKQISFHKKKKITKFWQNKNHLMQSMKVNAQVGYKSPVVSASLKMQAKVQSKKDFTFGQVEQQQVDLSETFEVNCPACSQCIIKQMIKSSNQNIPYVATLTYPDGQILRSDGVYKGTLVSQSYDDVVRVKLDDCTRRHK